MSVKTTNPLSRYFGEMEKKPLRKSELKHIFDELATRPSGATRQELINKQHQDTAAKKPIPAH